MSKYCSNCGTKISEGASFCGECGEKVILVEVNNNICLGCGYELKINEQYCPQCGKFKLDKPELQQKEIAIDNSSNKKKHNNFKDNSPIAKSRVSEKKQGGCLQKVGKTFLWILGLVIAVSTILYFIGDTEDTFGNKTKRQIISEETISEEEMKLPPMEVRQANPKLSETVTYDLLPNSEGQKISYSENIKIILPSNFTNLNQTLSVSIATVDPAIMIENVRPLMLVDLSLENNQQPQKPVEISYTYSKSDLDPNFTVAEQIDAFRWDKEGGGWVSLPLHIDEKNQTVSAIVDHFSIPGFFIKTSIVGIIGEKLLNDVYISHNKNFKILYSKKAVLADKDLNTNAWKSAPTGRTSTEKSDAPRYIQAIGYILEQVLTSYTSGHHFKNPAGIEKGYVWDYKKMITVKVDSWYSVVTGGNASYEKIYERLHIGTSQAFNYNYAKITLAHELFHRIQAEYYGVLGMSRRANQWWIEATAEYAAFNIAFPTKIPNMNKGCGTNYLNFPINDRGEKKGTGYGWTEREYEYVTSIWIDYLVANGASFLDMISYDAADYYMPVYSLEKYLYKTYKKSMPDFYREFANWMVFSPKGHLYKYPNLTSGGENDRDIAIKNSTLLLENKDEKSYTFNFPEKYSSQLWGITIGESNSNSITGKIPVFIEVKAKTTGIIIDVFRLPKMQSFVDYQKPLYTFYTDNETKMILAEEGEALCIVATQGRFSNGNAEVIVRSEPVQLEVEPSDLVDAVGNKPYQFKFKASDIPKEIENVIFEWDFSDNTKKSQGFTADIIVNGGEANTEVEHIYKHSDKEGSFPLKVILKESKSNVTIASASISVIMPVAKPAVFITTRQVVGPPGATFDLTAKASPKDVYNFQWYIQGMSKLYTYQGEESTFKPVAKKLGKYNVNVKLYNLKNEFLSEDNATIYVEEDEKSKELTDIEGGKVKEVIYRCDTYNYGCNVGSSGTIMFENSVKEMEKVIDDFIKQGRSDDVAKARKNLAKRKADFQLEKDTTSCNCQRKRTPTLIYE